MLTPIKAPLYYAQVEPITPTVDRPTGNDSPSILLDDGDMQYSYIVKVLDGDGKKGYKVHKLRTSKHFTSCMEIKDQLQESLKEHLSCDKFDIGYIEAGRQGIRGKTRWIFSSEDIHDMYESYKSAGKTEIILWCDGRRQVAGKKRQSPTTEENEGGSKKSRTPCGEAIRKAMDEVTIIYQKLDEKHHEVYSPEQLKVWAHLISNGTHTSYDIAPNKRFFHGRKNPSTSTSHMKDSNEFSPAKRCNSRSQYVVQLKDLHALYESGALSKQEFDDQKSR